MGKEPTEKFIKFASQAIRYFTKMQRNTLIVCLCIASFLSPITSRKLPSYVKVCKANDPELSKCWKESAEALRPYLKQDRPELNLPSLDPFHISEFTLGSDATASRLFLDSVITGLEANGTSDFQVLDNFNDLKNLAFEYTIFVPRITVSGSYKSKGKVLMIEFDSDGKLFAEFKNITYKSTWIGETYKKKGKEHLMVQAKDIDVSVGKIYMHIDDLIKGNAELTENMNQAINDNVDVLLQEFQPFIKKTITEIIQQYSNRFYSVFPLKVLYPEN